MARLAFRVFGVLLWLFPLAGSVPIIPFVGRLSQPVKRNSLLDEVRSC